MYSYISVPESIFLSQNHEIKIENILQIYRE